MKSQKQNRRRKAKRFSKGPHSNGKGFSSISPLSGKARGARRSTVKFRQYSISSSPPADPTIASIFSATVENQNAGETGNSHLGVAMNYLKSLKPESIVQISIKKGHKSFKSLLNDKNTPVIMVAAGIGIAPFQGFIMERVGNIKAGSYLA